MGFWNSLWGKNRKTGETKGQEAQPEPQMTGAQRHNAFVESLRAKAANGEYGPVVPTRATRRPSDSDDGGRDRADDPDAPGSLGRESGLKFGGHQAVSAAHGTAKGQSAGLGRGNAGRGGRSSGGHDHGER